MVSNDKWIEIRISLRRADNVPFGLELAMSDDGKYLIVVSIRSSGAVAAWNRQCRVTTRMIYKGDRLSKINDIEGAEDMLNQCREKYLLKLLR